MLLKCCITWGNSGLALKLSLKSSAVLDLYAGCWKVLDVQPKIQRLTPIRQSKSQIFKSPTDMQGAAGEDFLGKDREEKP